MEILRVAHKLLRKRSNLYHRPSNESESLQEYLDSSISLSSTPSDHVSDAPSVGKESSTPSLNLADAETVHRSYDVGVTLDESTDLKRSVEDKPEAANWKSRQMKDTMKNEQGNSGHHSEKLGTASDVNGTGNKLNKVKLKGGGVMHTIHTRNSSRSSSITGTFATTSSSEATYLSAKPNHRIAEAAQRRKIQNEKAARESKAEAIRKILGQESSRKRREEKIKKRQEELAQERNANAATVAPDAVRWVMGPSGTVVTFPDELGLPSIFEPKSCSYPPPREKCAGPSCTNVYKYRNSKSKLPLCSLQCYKALHAC